MTFGIATIRVQTTHGGKEPVAVPAVTVDGAVVPLKDVLAFGGERAPASVLEMLTAPSDWWARLADLEPVPGLGPGWLSADEVTFLPPLPDPPTIFLAGANYRDHIEEMTDAPVDPAYRVPYHFLAPSGALSGHRSDVRRPLGCEQLDWEVELAAVVGSGASNVDVDRALECIAGYTVANDLSARDLAPRPDVPLGIDWLRSKGQAGLLPMGPAIVPRWFVDDPQALALSLSVNGTVMQESTTKLMIFSLAEQIAALSQVVPLRPGDVICTGTPAGAGFALGMFLEPGDITIAQIEQVGQLETRIVATDGAK